MFTKTRIKLTVLLAVILILLYALLSLMAGEVVNTLTIGQVDRSMRTGAMELLHHENLLKLALNQPQPDNLPDNRISPHMIHSLFLVDIRSNNGQLLAENDKALAQAVPFSLSKENQIQFLTWRDPSSGNHLRLITVPIINGNGGRIGFLQLGMDISPQVQVLQKFWQVFSTVGVIGFVVALLAGYYVSGRALRPIKNSWVQQQRFVADASHELRTPLTIIQSNLDLALSHAEDTKVEVLEWVSNAKAEARRLTRLTDDLLTLARSDGNETVLEITEVELSSLVMEVNDLFSPLAEVKQIQLMMEKDTKSGVDFMVKGDRARLRQLLIILIDNALKYTLEDGVIKVILSQQRHHTILKVQDTGIGMDQKEMAHAFDRFYRADLARKRETGGTGLGLSIAKWIVEMHGAKLTVQSEKGLGSTFIVTF